jgi:hypothetical protein
MPNAIQELHGKLTERREKLAAIFDASKAADGRYNLDAARRDEVKSLNDEMTDLGKQYDQAVADDKAAGDNHAALKSLRAGRDLIPFDASGREKDTPLARPAVRRLGRASSRSTRRRTAGRPRCPPTTSTSRSATSRPP